MLLVMMFWAWCQAWFFGDPLPFSFPNSSLRQVLALAPF